MKKRVSLLALMLAGGLAALALSLPLASAAVVPDGPLPLKMERPLDFEGLHNVVRLSERLYSGGVPEGEAGFLALRRLGIKTLITVDGATPDVKRAREHGMRYVHLPFGYDGCPVPTANAIVKAVKDLPGPVYIHCHHGKHRSPTAAAFARIALDGISNEQAIRELERAGTGKNYLGLYAEVRAYQPPTPAELDSLKIPFPEVAKPRKLVREMIAIETRTDRLAKAQKAGWKESDGVDFAYEALQLLELYAELNRADATRKRPADYRKWMLDSETAAKALEAALRDDRRDDASAALGRVMATCGNCHAVYRNVPQRR